MLWHFGRKYIHFGPVHAYTDIHFIMVSEMIRLDYCSYEEHLF